MTARLLPRLALLVLTLSAAVQAALAQDAKSFQAMADEFAGALEAHDLGKLSQWYGDKLFFAASLAQGPIPLPIQDNKKEVLTYWQNLNVKTIKINVQEASSAPGAGPGWWLERSRAQIVTNDTPPRSIIGDRAVIWKPVAGKWQIDEEQWDDMSRCTEGPGGSLSCQ
jgi:hypothetical protein